MHYVLKCASYHESIGGLVIAGRTHVCLFDYIYVMLRMI